ncbi:MAG: hypothetical protein WDA00_02050 [Eubacteriales bacterium]
MAQRHISLLYPEGCTQGTPVRISEQVCREIGLTGMFELKNSRLPDYFTTEPAVIEYRQQTLGDMMRLPPLGETLRAVLPVLCDILELRRLERDGASSTGESYLYSITEIELYIRCIDTLYGGLAPVKGQVTSAAFRALGDFVSELAESAYYRELNAQLKQLSARMLEVRSITVGVNLDTQMRPYEAGVISVNADTFKSGKVLDKILRFSFRNDAMTCIAALSPVGRGQSSNQAEALNSAFYAALEEVFRGSVKSWRSIVGAYVLENTDFLLKILPEIEFVTRAVALQQRLLDKGYTLCLPVMRPMAEKGFTAKQLYNPDVALRIEAEMVGNDFAFDEQGRIFVLTGPNRGGKSVHTCAVGLGQAMAQLGLPVPAESAEISPVDGIYTHFPQGADDTIDKGRLGEECVRLRQIFEQVTENSLVLLDESLSSTGAFEAAYIAAEVLAGFGLARCRGVFSTHLHELAAAVPAINEKSLEGGGVQVDTMVAAIEAGQRSFKIVRAKPVGKSYAEDIAKKYGLGVEDIRTLIDRKTPR